jgi:hypothetical protein
MLSYNAQLAKPAWWLLDAAGAVVASIRADTAIEARDAFKREGLTGARVKKAEVAPVDETAKPPQETICEMCGRQIMEENDYRWVGGWERISRNGAGGTHAIRTPDRTSPRRGCMFCVDRAANGVSPHQTTLE